MELLNRLRFRLWFKAVPYGKRFAWWLGGVAQLVLNYFSVPVIKAPHTYPAPPVTFSLPDIRVYEGERQIGTVQKISWVDASFGVSGELVILILDKIPYNRGYKIPTLQLRAANEYGQTARPLLLQNVTLTEVSSAISTLDPTLEVTYKFVAESVSYNAV